MGTWGFYENENDEFLDYIGDDISTENLLKALKKKYIDHSYIVAIFRVLKNKKLMPIKSIKEGIKYLDDYIAEKRWEYEDWNDYAKRKKAVIAQKKAMERHLKARRPS